MYLLLLRAELGSLFGCLYKEWNTCARLPARINSLACICVFARFENQTFFSMRLHTSRADIWSIWLGQRLLQGYDSAVMLILL